MGGKAIETRLARAELDPASEREVVEELAQHMADQYEELRRSCVSEEECCRQVLADLARLNPLVAEARLVHRPSLSGSGLGVPKYGKTHMHGTIHDLEIAFATFGRGLGSA